MTNLEFIEKEIQKAKELLQRLEKLKVISNKYELQLNEVLEKDTQEKLFYLQQIKSELEAWEVCKKHYHINKYEDINKGRDKKRFDITIWLNTENCDFKSCASYEECLKVKNALEVKKNECNE